MWWRKTARGSAWVEVGTPEWVGGWVTASSGTFSGVASNDTLKINGTDVYNGTTLQPTVTATNVDLADKINNNSALNTWLFAFAPTTGPNAGKVDFYVTPEVADIIPKGFLQFEGTLVAKMGLMTDKYIAPALVISSHVSVPKFSTATNVGSKNGYASGSIWIKTSATDGASWSVKQYSSSSDSWTTMSAPLYDNNLVALQNFDPTNGGLSIPVNTIYVNYNDYGAYTSRANVPNPTMKNPKFADFK